MPPFFDLPFDRAESLGDGSYVLATYLAFGVTDQGVAVICRDLGPDAILGVGRVLQGHPDGAAAGAKATLRAVEAAASGVTQEEAARQCPELWQAMEIWQ